MLPDSTDPEIRAAAFNFLEEVRARHGDVIPRTELLRGFEFRGTTIRLMSFQRGIWKPRFMTGAPLSITTTPHSPYGDRYDETTQRLEYHYFGSDPNSSDNRSLRDAFRLQTPLIYFHGVLEGQYMAFWPCYVRADHPEQLMCQVQIDDPTSLRLARTSSIEDRAGDLQTEIRRGYVTRLVKARIHQERFRQRVLEAYRTRCAFCRLKHSELLSAAHITADSDPDGEPKVSNGIALCALHHSAFDRFFVAIRPDLTIEVRPDLLREKDGPTLVHAVQALHDQKILTPNRPTDQLDRDRLIRRYDEYRLIAGRIV